MTCRHSWSTGDAWVFASFFSSAARFFSRHESPSTQLVNVSLENPNTSLNDPAVWDALTGGQKSRAGIAVNHKISLTLGPVWHAVSMISGDVASMTLNVYERLEDDDRQIADDHPAEEAVSQQANEEQSSWEVWRLLMVHALLWGNGHLYIGRDVGDYRLFNLLPDRTRPARTPAGKLFYVTEVDGRLETMRAEDVLHVKGLALCGDAGADLVWYARDTFGQALARDRFTSKFFASGAQMGGILEIPHHIQGQARQKVVDGFVGRTSNEENWFRVAILREGAKFHSTQINPQQAQTTEMDEQQRRAIADFFNLPPAKLGVKGSVSYNSHEQSTLEYLQSCLTHWLRAISSACNTKLLTREERRTHYFEHNTSNWIEVDTQTMTDVLVKQRSAGFIMGAEARRKLNLPKNDDPSLQSFANPNTTPGAPVGKDKGQAEPKPDKDDEPETGDPAVKATKTPTQQPTDDVQATALNGAQIASLLEIADRLVNGQLPMEGTRALLRGSFPAMPESLVDTIVKELEKFEPEKMEAPPKPPAEPPESDDKANRLARHYLTLTVNRAAARLGHEARTYAKSPTKFLAWLDAGAASQRAAVEAMIRDTLEPLGGDSAARAASVTDRLFADMLNRLRPLVDPPYTQDKLQANVAAACDEFEKVASAMGDAELTWLPVDVTPGPRTVTKTVIEKFDRDADGFTRLKKTKTRTTEDTR